MDDCLAYDADFDTHVHHVRVIRTRAIECGVTISPKKFELGMSKVDFCGVTLCEEGWTVNDDKIAAIKNFPMPTCRMELRSFMGLVNQFSDFTKCLADVAQPIRHLLKTTVNLFGGKVIRQSSNK